MTGIKKLEKRVVRCGLLLAALALAACGGSSGNGGLSSPPAPPPPPPPPPGGAAVQAVDAFPNLPNIGAPTKVVVEPGVLNPRWFALRKAGQLLVFDPAAATGTSDYLTIGNVNPSGEGGLLGMAFHPDYPGVPEIFLSYTTNGVGGNELRSVISRFVLDDVTTPGGGTVEEVIIEIDQFRNNHNGGDIAFGADRLLYIGLGDGGGGGDPEETGQDTTRLLGSFLRIDVIGTGAGYTIPQGNPFSNEAPCGPDLNANSCPEIYAWGMRNPWRFSFDPVTGVLWAGDVGQGAWEEIDQVELGGNYGWDCREGAHDFETTGCNGAYIDPVAEYGRTEGVSVTGGYVYRGTAIPGLAGRYVFGDFGSGRIWTLADDGMGGFTREELVSTGDSISSFSVDQDGEIYYTDYSGGRIMQLVPADGG